MQVHGSKKSVHTTPYTCQTCGMIFAVEDDLKGHIKRQHSKDIETKLPSTNANEQTIEEESNDAINCDKCDFKSTSEVIFRQHILTAHVPGFTCHECKCTIKPKDLVIDCVNCEFCFHKKCTDLSKSQGGHWKPKSWKCSYCSTQTSSGDAPTERTEDESLKNINEKLPASNPDKIIPSARHRKSNIKVDNPETEFLKCQLDSCRGIIAQREAELKKVKESETLKAKRIMKHESQLQEAINLINKSSPPTQEQTQNQDAGNETPRNASENI